MTVITTASVNTATATSTYPPAPSCSKIAPYIPAVSIGWPCTVPTVPTRDRNSRTHRGRQTADAPPHLSAAVFRYSLFYQRNTLFCIVHTRKTSSLKTQLKKPFIYIGTKTRKNSHPKIIFFQKNLGAAQRQLPKEKIYFIMVSDGGQAAFPLSESAQAEDRRYTAPRRRRQSADYRSHER